MKTRRGSSCPAHETAPNILQVIFPALIPLSSLKRQLRKLVFNSNGDGQVWRWSPASSAMYDDGPRTTRRFQLVITTTLEYCILTKVGGKKVVGPPPFLFDNKGRLTNFKKLAFHKFHQKLFRRQEEEGGEGAGSRLLSIQAPSPRVDSSVRSPYTNVTRREKKFKKIWGFASSTVKKRQKTSQLFPPILRFSSEIMHVARGCDFIYLEKTLL